MTHEVIQTSAADTAAPFDPATFSAQFHHDTVSVNGVRLHFVDGDSGAPTLLLPGWPRIGYALAAEWPQDVRRLAVLDAALPGITPPPAAGIPSAEANVKTWHFAFNRLDDLPEVLLQGREREFLAWLFKAKSARPRTITPADLDEYVRVNAAPGATRAALSYYRHKLSPEGIARSRARAERKLAMPVLALGADTGVGTTLIDTMRLVATEVSGGVFAGCGHYMPEEAPRAVAGQLIRFMSA